MSRKYKFGVLGHNIDYSKSPDLFTAVAQIAGVECDCRLFDVAPDDLEHRFPEILKSGVDGFSVTIPHKQRVIPYLKQVDSVAELVGAVNSVGLRGGSAYGYNTDSHGFSVALADHREALKDGTAFVIGSGGAAMAVIHCLHTQFELGRFYLIGRNLDKLTRKADIVRKRLTGINIEPVKASGFGALADMEYDIVVNCTPAGGWNQPEANPMPDGFQWRAGKIFCDLSYNAGNKLVARAANESMVAYDGSIMLIGQALRSLYLWTGLEVPFEPVYRAVFGDQWGAGK